MFSTLYLLFTYIGKKKPLSVEPVSKNFISQIKPINLTYKPKLTIKYIFDLINQTGRLKKFLNYHTITVTYI